MSSLSPELRELIQSGPMAHLSTISPDGSPQVTVIWIGLDGDDPVSAHMGWHVKLRNIARHPRRVEGQDDPRVPLDVAQLHMPRHMRTDDIIAVQPDPDDGHLRAPVRADGAQVGHRAGLDQVPQFW